MYMMFVTDGRAPVFNVIHVYDVCYRWEGSGVNVIHLYDVCYRWEGSGVDEIGRDEKTDVVRVKINPKFYRPTEVVSNSPHSGTSETNIYFLIHRSYYCTCMMCFPVISVHLYNGA